jgi:hypothetical protein
MLAIQKGNHNFGTTSHCRVPLRLRASQVRVTKSPPPGLCSNEAGFLEHLPPLGSCRARLAPVLVCGTMLLRDMHARYMLLTSPWPSLRPAVVSRCCFPVRLQQRVTPDVQTGCISCASGDGKFGGPIWWNTPMDDADAEAEGAEANRSTWGAPGGGGGGGGGGQQQQGGSRKRPGEDLEDEDELPDEVRARLEALKRAG